MLVGTNERERRFIELREAGRAQIENLERHARCLRRVGDGVGGRQAGISQQKEAIPQAEMIVE